MDKFQCQTSATQTPHPFIPNLPYQPSFTQRIPLHTFSRPHVPEIHPYYSQTTVYLPARSIQTKVIGPPITLSPYHQRTLPAYSVRMPSEDVKKIDSRQLQLRRQHEKEKVESKQNPSIESILQKHENMIQDLSKSNRKVKQQNEQLRIQNTILLDKLAKISKSPKPTKAHEESPRFKTDDVYDTDADSFVHAENRIRRIRSFEVSNFNQSRQDDYCEPCLVKCCTKCLKNVMNAKIDHQSQHQQRFVQEPTAARWAAYTERPRQQKNSRVKSEKESNIRPRHNYGLEASELCRIKQQDINTAIKRLKKQNKMLKRYL